MGRINVFQTCAKLDSTSIACRCLVVWEGMLDTFDKIDEDERGFGDSRQSNGSMGHRGGWI